MNVRHLFGMDCLVNFSPRLIDINLSIPPTQPATRFSVSTTDPFFLSVSPRTLKTFMLRSAKWNMMIPFIWMKSKLLTCLDPLDHLCVANIWLLSNFRREWHSKNFDMQVTVIYVTTIPFCKHYFKGYAYK